MRPDPRVGIYVTRNIAFQGGTSQRFMVAWHGSVVKPNSWFPSPNTEDFLLGNSIIMRESVESPVQENWEMDSLMELGMNSFDGSVQGHLYSTWCVGSVST